MSSNITAEMQAKNHVNVALTITKKKKNISKTYSNKYVGGDKKQNQMVSPVAGVV